MAEKHQREADRYRTLSDELIKRLSVWLVVGNGAGFAGVVARRPELEGAWQDAAATSGKVFLIGLLAAVVLNVLLLAQYTAFWRYFESEDADEEATHWRIAQIAVIFIGLTFIVSAISFAGALVILSI